MTSWPSITITHHDNGTATVTSAGITIARLQPSQHLHHDAMNIALAQAKHYNRVLPVTATGPEGTYYMSVHPDGHIQTHDTPEPTASNTGNASNTSNTIDPSNPSDNDTAARHNQTPEHAPTPTRSHPHSRKHRSESKTHSG